MKDDLVRLMFLVAYKDILRPGVGVVAQVLGEIALLPGGDGPVGHSKRANATWRDWF